MQKCLVLIGVLDGLGQGKELSPVLSDEVEREARHTARAVPKQILGILERGPFLIEVGEH